VAAEAEVVRAPVAQELAGLVLVHPVMAAWVARDMVAWVVRDMAARVVSGTAFRHRPRAWHTRYIRCFQARTSVTDITAHQASAQDMRCKRRWHRTSAADITAHQASAQDMRCKRRWHRTSAADITAHQASAQDTRCKRRLRSLKSAASVLERRGSLLGALSVLRAG